MAPQNRLSRMVSLIKVLPSMVGNPTLNLLLGRVVPYVGTSGLQVLEMTPERVTVKVPNRSKVRNHIGSVHAVATALSVETATGFVVGMNVPDDRLPLLKSMRLDYVKRSRGDITATARLTRAQRAEIEALPRGSVAVEAHVFDGSGEEPVKCQMVWAWVPRKS